jgi:hypothetical protein
MNNARRSKVAIPAVALILCPTLGHARDYGQYEDSTQHMRDWFKALKHPQTGGSCCDESDCAPTEARTHGNGWDARAPDGSWITIPADKVVHKSRKRRLVGTCRAEARERRR